MTGTKLALVRTPLVDPVLLVEHSNQDTISGTTLIRTALVELLIRTLLRVVYSELAALG